jgi:abhydrolase domain-containing protein 17
MGSVVSAIAFPFPDPELSRRLLESRKDQLVWLKTKSGYKIHAFQIRKEAAPFTILFSHGNGEDVGLLLPHFENIAEICHCSVFAYEYPGYSITEGEPSERNCYEAVDAAYQYLLDSGISPEHMILYGRSLGTGVAVDLCSRTPNMGGCILESPLESGIRVFLGPISSLVLYPLDIFRSYQKVGAIQCHVFIMHGEEDRVVPCASGKALYKRLQKRKCHPQVAYEPFWIPGHGHNNMPEQECLNHCASFLRYLEQKRGEAAEQERDEEKGLLSGELGNPSGTD